MKDRKDFWVSWLIVWGIVIAFILIINTFSYFLCDGSDCNHRFLGFKIISQIFVLVTAIIYIICNFIDYVAINVTNNESVRMKFSHFKDVYYINPDRWDISYWSWENKYSRLRYCNRGRIYYVTFSYFDWLKFLLWRKRRKYEEMLKNARAVEEANNERLAEMLKYIQKDINEAYEKINYEK